MKFTYPFLALLFCGQLSYGQQNYFTIQGKLTEKTTYKYAYLNYQSTAGFKQDSSLIKNGTFNFKGIPEYGTHAYIQLKNSAMDDTEMENQFDFMIEPVNFKISADGNLNEAHIEGSPIDKDFQELKRVLKPAELAREKWYERYDKFTMSGNTDSTELNRYIEEYDKIK